MFKMRCTDELVQIAAAGGGFVLEAATRRTDELIQIAAAAARKGARVTFAGMSVRPVAELIQIAAAGAGNVVFLD